MHRVGNFGDGGADVGGVFQRGAGDDDVGAGQGGAAREVGVRDAAPTMSGTRTAPATNRTISSGTGVGLPDPALR
ncbi:MAG: hypothetical protein M5R36_19025 [Deltaproteobacteria bacterium]|nr:hypothetical protein [Deltaproteobacteria bacterium]